MTESGESRKRRVDALFDAALDLDDDEIPGFLDREAEDPEIRAAVERLLGFSASPSDADAPTLLDDTDISDTLAVDAGGVFGGALGLELGRSLNVAPALPGERFGPYEVIGELGRGGMAAVYRARRADGHFAQEVALKLSLDIGRDPTALQRFHQERQILASLRHPSIARLLDGGITAEGRPWFAMELVEGERIDVWCDSRRLTVEERLRLFLEAARAVESAHRALVVHRDLKPSNILVAETKDGRGRVKLLDFGIAKLVDDDTPGLTRTGVTAMTPEFASPEQIQGSLVTTASDIYQLGLLLYELLAGRRAHRIRRQSPMDIWKAVLETVPDPPSAAPSRPPDPTSGDTASTEELCDLRRTTPRALRRTLAGDLDTIVLQALRKEPQRRYRSAGDLADDVERFLGGRPVAARGDSVAYRVQKFVHRHPFGVGAATLGLLWVLFLVIFYTARLDTERTAAEAAAERADAARDEAEAVADFLVNLFEEADPARSGAQDVSARDLLRKGAERLAVDWQDNPLVKARLLFTISHTQQRVGDAAEAEAPAREALELRQANLPADHLDVAAASYRLGKLLLDLGKLDEAEPHLRRALAIQEDRQATRLAGLTASVLGDWHRLRGETDEAERVLRRAMQLLRDAPDAEAVDLSRPHLNLGLLLQDVGRFDEAREAYEEAHRLDVETYGADHIETAPSLNNMANLEIVAGRYEEGLKRHRQVLDIRLKALGPEHPSVAGSLINVASTLTSLKRLEEAQDALQEARAILETTLGPEHSRLANVYKLLGDVAAERGLFGDAVAFHRRQLHIRELNHGPTHVAVASALTDLASFLDDVGAFAEAESKSLRAIEIFDGFGDNGHVYGGITRINLADLYRQTGRSAAAVPILEKSVDILSRGLGTEHPITQIALTDLADTLDHQGRMDDAAALRTKLVKPADGS